MVSNRTESIFTLSKSFATQQCAERTYVFRFDNMHLPPQSQLGGGGCFPSVCASSD
jgi:hypothetical protein